MRWFHVLIQANTSCATGNRRRRRPDLLNCAAEVLEARALLSAPEVRSIDGTGNNLAHAAWGSAGSDLLRTAPAAYGDGISTPAGVDRPSARVISNTIDAQSTDIENDRSMSDFVYVWGQFVDHDMDLTGSASPAVSFNVAVPKGDPSFDPNSTGTKVIPLNRSLYDLATGTSAANPRQQINQITSFIDGSMVYGSDAARAEALRSHVGGRLLVSAGNLLPFNTAGLANANDAHLVPDNQLFLAGDVRANENIELTAMHTLFVREHNRLADQIHAANPKLSDEQIYQQARAIVGAEIQSITYNEFLPALLGDRALTSYKGYNPNVNPGIANEFSTAIFRVGHTMLDGTVDRLDNLGNELTGLKGNVSLAGAFFNPRLLNVDPNRATNPTGTDIDPFLKGIASGDAQEIDNKIIDEVRNFLFGPPGAGGLDLASLNIQRGRDHGLADYNTVRAAYGLPRVTSFAQITSNVTLQNQLKALYGNVNNIDLWVGALAEDHVRGSSVGPLVQKVIADQFQRLRDGDRFWFERQFSGKQLDEIEHTTLADIIRRNTGITNVQDNVFIFQTAITGRVFADVNRDGRAQPNEAGIAGRTIQLFDAQGALIATTVTGKDGFYRFTGLELGIYSVREVLVSGVTQTTPATLSVQLTRSQTVDHEDFGETVALPAKPKTPAPSPPGKSSMPDFEHLAASQIGKLLNQDGPNDPRMKHS
ncbi:MAG: peroxidase [Planctomycetia bacterium]|nr:peroxidase [Planctomycetia bacterium]